MNFHILTLFPEMVLQGLTTSVIGRAVKQEKIRVEAVNIRDFTEDAHGRVDDYTYGGGAGMLMQAQPVYDAFLSVRERIPDNRRTRVIYVTPQGRPFTQQAAQELAGQEELVLLCGHYEGVDERVLEEIVTDYISIGDYVLTGGELAAMVIVDAVARLVPSVLHNEESAQTESFHGNLLEYPQYSRPEEWHGKRVPAVLLSGNRGSIDRWRREKSEERTRERRPDLYASYQALKASEERMRREKLLHIDMIELIRRGRAILLERRGEELLLSDSESPVLFHTCMGAVDAEHTLLCGLRGLRGRSAGLVVLHQPEFVPVLEAQGYRLEMECQNAVYTRKEQLPVRGLYGADGRVLDNGLTIRPLTPEQLPALAESYPLADADYLRGRVLAGAMYGAFVQETLAGFIGVHEEGGIGLLTVFPEFRRKRVASALETYLCNQFLQQGMTPYGQVAVGNGASAALQERLGLCMARERVYWMRSPAECEMEK